MACDYPLTAWKPRPPNTQWVFQRSAALMPDDPQSVPCGQCMGCRIDKSLEWGDRATHEAQLYDDNCIVTLTYEDKHLPEDGSIRKIVLSKFVRSLRDANDGKLIRFMGCGEYGDQFRRPHYHVVLFNHTFADRVHWSTGPSGARQYTSPHLTKRWPYGLATFADFTPEGARYVGRYCTKKITGDRAADHYVQPHPVSGELHRVEPEFLLTSRRPGLGRAWVEKFYDDIYPSGHIMRDGSPAPIPRYYDKILKEAHSKKLKVRNRLKALELRKRKEAPTVDRRKARALIRDARMSLIKR